MIRPAVALGALAVTLTACTSVGKPERVVTVTVPPTGTSAPASGSTAPSTAPTTQAAQTSLPGSCDGLLPDYTVAQAIGRSSFRGEDSFVVGVAQKDIGRLANINCRYGVTGSGAAQKRLVEIGVSLYGTPAQATSRIGATVADYTAHGATAADVTVSGATGHLLTGGSGADYADPTLVVAVGQRTVAVTVTSGLASGGAAGTDATKIAELAASKTAG